MVKESIPYAHDLRADIATLIEATEGKRFVEIWSSLVVAAVEVDDGTLKDTLGKPGWAWKPDKYASHKDPVHARLAQASASLGWLLFTGRAYRRTVGAYTEAVYYVTCNQNDDVAKRIEKLWDDIDRSVPQPEYVPPPKRPSLLRRLLHWLREFVRPQYYDDGKPW